MQNNQQFEQLMLRYTQLKNGSEDIYKMILAEDFDNAIVMINSREEVFKSCKAMRNYLELSEEQEKSLNSLLDELREQEKKNMDTLSESLQSVRKELKQYQKNKKIQQAYDFDMNQKGNIINYKE